MKRLFQRLWHGELQGVTLAAFVLGGASLASRLIGLLRDRLLASTFGAGDQLDAYYAAFRIPDTLYNLLILGALTSAFIPVFTEYLETKGEKAAWLLAERVLSLVAAVLIVVCLAFVVAAAWIVPWTAPGFSADKLSLTVNLSRIMALSPLLLGLSAVMGGVLQSTRRFFAFALAPILYNLGIIVGTLFLAPRLGVAGVAWGVVAGALLHMLAQGSVVSRLGLRSLHWPSVRDEGLRRIFKLMGPRTAGLAVSQVNLIILLALASSLESGSVSVFNLANNLQIFPIGLIGVSFAVAAFPTLSRSAATHDQAVFVHEFYAVGKKIIFLTAPIMVLYLLLRAQIVRLILGQGAFDWHDTIRTVSVLEWFAASMILQALIPLLARAFYALQDTWTPFWVGLAAEILNVSLAYLLRDKHGVIGLAMAFSAAAALQAGWLWLRLRQKHAILPDGGKWYSLSIIKIGLGSAVCLLVAYTTRESLGTIFTLNKFWQVALQGSASAMSGLVAYLIAMHLLRSEEYFAFKSALLKRLTKNQLSTIAPPEGV